jgi:hypothetical protein
MRSRTAGIALIADSVCSTPAVRLSAAIAAA